MLTSGHRLLKRSLQVIFCLVLLSLPLVAGCSKEEQKPQQHTLTYSAGANGSIKGESSQVVDHGGTGSQVTAEPDKFSHFVAWSDGVTSPERREQNVTGDVAVTASFAVNRYVTLAYTAGENGSIDGVAAQAIKPGDSGSPVTAVPASGYHFDSWSDGSTANPRTDHDVTDAIAVTASFAVNQYTLTYSAQEHGSIDGVSSQSVVHGGAGSKVTAVPAESYHFAGWSDGVTTASRTDRKVTADLTVTANFAIEQYILAYSAGDHGTIAGTSRQTVNTGDSGSKVTAVPADGYHFVGWSDGSTANPRTDRDVTGAIAVTAGFAVNQYTLTYSAQEHGSIDGVSSQSVDHGSDAEPVTAVAEKGYHFVKWSDGVTTAMRSDSGVKSDLTVRALFAINTYSVGGRIADLIKGTRVVLQNNGGDALVITANGEFTFTAELLDAADYEVTVQTQPTSPNQVCTVENDTGTISEADVTDISVSCVLRTYTVGGTISGIPAGDRVMLQNNDGDDLIVESDGPFVFATPLDDGSPYLVKVANPPAKPNWTCEVEKGVGSLAGLDISGVVVDCFPRVVLEATAGIRKIKLKWNAGDFSKVIFNLCRTQEEIPGDGFNGCQKLQGGVTDTNIDSPLAVTQLINDTPYWFQLEAQYLNGRRTLSEVVEAMPFGGLNDSGIDWCANGYSNLDVDRPRAEKAVSCASLASGFPLQDALHGRDALASDRRLKKTGTGSAGFDFTKLCSNGKAAGEGRCPPNPLPGNGLNNWACTRDNVTGLTWEVKAESGLRSKDNTYSWQSPDSKVNGGEPGLSNGGTCEGSRCDSLAYIEKVNETGLCGISDWRLPTRQELLSIVDNSTFKPAVDLRFFPNTVPAYYWSSTPYAEQQGSAWQVYFKSGEADPDEKSLSRHVRLVNGQTTTFGLDNP